MFSVFQTCCNLAVAFFPLNLGTFNAADAGGNAAPADSSTSAPTESCTCCTLSSVYCLRLRTCTHMQPDEYAGATQHTDSTHTRTHACAPFLSEETNGLCHICQKCVQVRKRCIQPRRLSHINNLQDRTRVRGHLPSTLLVLYCEMKQDTQKYNSLQFEKKKKKERTKMLKPNPDPSFCLNQYFFFHYSWTSLNF